jgi:hypothetical protein
MIFWAMIWVKQAPRIKYLNSSAAWRGCCGAGCRQIAELQAHTACHIHLTIVCAEQHHATREITDLLLQRQTVDSLHARGHDDGGRRARAPHFVVKPVAHKTVAIRFVRGVEIGVVQGIPDLQEFA